jgi:DNA polymerase epsilon subunit 1
MSLEEVVEKMRDYFDEPTEELMRFIDDLRNGRVGISAINQFIISLKMKDYIKVDLGEELMTDIDELRSSKVATSAITQFVVSLSHVFLHDKDLYNELATLKRMLLAQLQVRDFSEDSQFHESDASYILRDVICSFCSTCKDIDLIHVFDDKVFNDNPDADNRWKCECGNIVDRIEIENRLLDDVKRFTVSYQVQDLRCASTHMVSSRLCAAHSELSRPLVLDQTIGNTKKKFSILQKVAKLHNFELLQDTIKDMQYFSI